MDIQSEKYKLMEWLISLKDESVISKIKNIKNSLSVSSDWADDISETEKLLITFFNNRMNPETLKDNLFKK